METFRILIASQKDAYRQTRETITTGIHLSLTLEFNRPWFQSPINSLHL